MDVHDHDHATGSPTHAPASQKAVHTIVGDVATLFTKAMQVVLRDSAIRKISKAKKNLDKIKLALETCVLAQLHTLVWDLLSGFYSEHDRLFNRVTRNLSHITDRDLELPPALTRNMPEAISQISLINAMATPLDKLYRIRGAIATLTSQGDAEGSEERAVVISADELVPLISLLMIQAEVPNWHVNLEYMTQFQFSGTMPEQFAYLLVSVEAAAEHLQAGGLAGVQWRPRSNSDALGPGPGPPGPRSPRTRLNRFLEAVTTGDVDTISTILKAGSPEEIKKKLCHPLCECDECVVIVNQYQQDPSIVSVNSRDAEGCTALHVAARLGKVDVINTLLDQNAKVDSTNYIESTPLHLACQRDMVDCVLILLGAGANINAKDNDGNTALHFCAENGHERCAKVLLFQSPLPNLDTVNNRGDTALHLAAKWGFLSLIEVLLFHGASRAVRNSKGQTAATIAHSPLVLHAMKAQTTLSDQITLLQSRNTAAAKKSAFRKRATSEQWTTTEASDLGKSAEPPSRSSTAATSPVVVDNPMGGAIGMDADFEAPSESPGMSQKDGLGGAFDMSPSRRKQSLRRWRGTWFGGAQPPDDGSVAADTGSDTSGVRLFLNGLDEALSIKTSKVSVCDGATFQVIGLPRFHPPISLLLACSLSIILCELQLSDPSVTRTLPLSNSDRTIPCRAGHGYVLRGN